MISHLVLLLASLALLIKAADVLVEAAARLARRLGVSDLVVGLVITSIGTSLPEITASIAAAAKDIEAAIGAPDALVHNAGIAAFGSVEDFPAQAWEQMFTTNLFGPIALTRALLPAMRAYLEIHRPILLSKSEMPHDFLWVNDWGNRYSHSNLGARISRLTQKMLGVAVSPHLMRDAAATTIARLAPSRSRAIAGALGHATLRTADQHYNQARCLDASRAYAPYIEELVEDASAKHSVRIRRRETNR